MRTNFHRNGFTLLEILLALAILGGSLAILGTIARTGTSAARESRDLAVARILCQTKLTEILLENISPQPVVDIPITSADSGSMSPFSYSVEVMPAPLDGMLAIRVTVVAANPDGGSALATYSLSRWMIDPDLGLEALEAAEAAEAEAAAEAALTSATGGGI
ncbi:hypothetical protein Q31b_22190 [Novipirellula aureliae]|uniref:Prepilin-type N-terminal cleavage/methylation domain-containing protein n=1 Tax=Novipirellula aureliae TaxID=2527966 RepID=A0A5C6E6B9_9BACT|nr:prepilin-type N-terminal cleavage/methylation domain-containing protein [Novipirellula aureliae]TWU43181.1 hypothetical protein Q31b_22190 [Novipirellula aureliae]